MSNLGIKFNILLNDLSIKSAYGDLSKVAQENVLIATNNFYNVTNISKVCFIRTSKPVTLKITNTNNLVQTLPINDSLFISGQFLNIKIENANADSVDVFIVSA